MQPLKIIMAVYFLSCYLVSPLSAQTADDAKQPLKLHSLNPKTPDELKKLLSYTGTPLSMVSAHRGGPRKGFPENCIATFENTLKHTSAIMEIDPRYTKDGSIVLLHDPTLERTTTGKGKIVDFTLEQLKQLKLKDSEGNLTGYSMPTLDEALQWARGKTILICDRKGIPVEDLVKIIQAHNAQAYTMVMAYNLEDVKTCYRLDKNIMMEIFITSQKQYDNFERSGVPWSNVVVFVGHLPPEDTNLYKMIHDKGAICIEGTSRNLDRKIINKQITNIRLLEKDYRELLNRGADLIETDIPVEVGQLLLKVTGSQNNKEI